MPCTTPDSFDKNVKELYDKDGNINAKIEQKLKQHMRELENQIIKYKDENAAVGALYNVSNSNLTAYYLKEEMMDIYRLQYITNILMIFGIIGLIIICYFAAKKV